MQHFDFKHMHWLEKLSRVPLFSYFAFKCLILPVKLFVNCFTLFFVPKNGDSALSRSLEKQQLPEKQL